MSTFLQTLESFTFTVVCDWTLVRWYKNFYLHKKHSRYDVMLTRHNRHVILIPLLFHFLNFRYWLQLGDICYLTVACFPSTTLQPRRWHRKKMIHLGWLTASTDCFPFMFLCISFSCSLTLAATFIAVFQ